MMRRAAVLAALALLASAPASWGAVHPPDWVQRHLARHAGPAAVPAEAPGEILFRGTRLTVMPDGEVRIEQRRLYRVLRPEGAYLAEADTGVGSRDQLEEFRGWERLPGGDWQEWRRKDAVWVNPLLGYPGYLRYRTVVLTLPEPSPGTLIAFEIRRRLRPLILQHIWRFQQRAPDLDARLMLQLPPGWRAIAHWRHWTAEPGAESGSAARFSTLPRMATGGPRRRAAGTRQAPRYLPVAAAGAVRQWEVRDVPGLPPQPRMPTEQAVAAVMSLALAPPPPAPPNALSPLSPQATASWYLGLTAGRTEPTPAIEAEAAALTAGQNGEAAKIAALAQFVQQKIRYAAVEFGIGDYQPHAAAAVLANGYGDCKDKATLLIALLRTVGVQADYVLLNAQRGVVPSGYASPGSFDHVIVAIRWPAAAPAGGLYAWLGTPGAGHLLLFDPTDPRTPWGWLPAAEQGGEATLVARAGGRAIRLPVLGAALNRRFRSAQFAMLADGSLRGSVREIRTGSFASEAAGELELTAEQRGEWMARLDEVLPGIQMADWRGQQAGSTVLLDYQLTIQPYLQMSGTTAVLQPWLFPLAAPDLFENGKRRYPIHLGMVGSQTDLYRIRLARNLLLSGLPPTAHFVLPRPVTGRGQPPYASYSSQIRLDSTAQGPVLRVQRTLTINAFRVPAGEYAAVQQFWRQVRHDEDRLIFGQLVPAAAPAQTPPAPGR